ncbi:phosphatase PAP2 family protein [Aquincola sp. MAHUQ-54]|uniref:Phosphatase PAP2 family protein n=1 Tax=Aquincola agrisoli TaxID=3119538 RepID=A0AAW9QMK3_9BURK
MNLPFLPFDAGHDAPVWLAERLADHALAWYAAGLGVVMLAAVAGWLLLRRVVRPHAPGLPLPPLQLVLRLALGLLALAGAGLLFAETADELADGEESLGRFDEALAARLAQTLSPAVLRGFASVTHLGDVLTLTLLCVAVAAVLLWRRRRTLAWAWVLACAGGGVLNRLLKSAFERVRPVHEHGFAAADGYSFPSGHTSGAVVVYGMLAYLLLRHLPPRWHLPVVAATAALVFTVACSRVVLQVHWASDVIAGFASGTAWLLMCVLVIEWLRRPRRP